MILWDLAIKPLLQKFGFLSEKEEKVAEASKALTEDIGHATVAFQKFNDALKSSLTGEDLQKNLENEIQSLQNIFDRISTILSEARAKAKEETIKANAAKPGEAGYSKYTDKNLYYGRNNWNTLFKNMLSSYGSSISLLLIYIFHRAFC